ncbi:unnamed protein product [Arabidopsis thaliana]|uniref:Pectinesterase catalytic domain-containing protein n=1 Tax=Arabidopsis thaliana TaxID=3702 RepID=A0A5S9XIX8_ARATH|nr:unnamed protein product [Arabidopsis thaliana]VYS59156.1 unnamed protein product [Arabidopsis thaliana]
MTSYYVEEEETNLEMCLNDNYEEWWHEDHGSKSPLTRDISFLGKENYVKQGEVLEYKGATMKEYNCQRLPRHEEKLDNHTLLYRGPKASRQAKPRHKFFHTNPRVVQEVLQEVTQRTSMWGKPYPRDRRDYLAERDSRISNLRGGELTVDGSAFMAQDLCILNTAGPEKRQAVALRISADATVVYRCRINAYQDTLCCSVS